jgi:subtilisin-like proprotein convertase family protein
MTRTADQVCMPNPFLLILASAFVLTASALSAGPAAAATFSNGGAITINVSGDATPYPSTIPVSGVSGTVTDVDVKLNSFSHTRPSDVGVLLVGPGGQSLLLMDGVTNGGGGMAQPATNLNFTIDDEAPTQLPMSTPLSATSYRPAAYVSGDVFPAPGPGDVYGNPGPAAAGTETLSTIFDGTSPNGTWSLFVEDFSGANSGQIAAGWSLVFPDAAPAPTKKKCKKGRKLKKVKGKVKCVKKKKGKKK